MLCLFFFSVGLTSIKELIKPCRNGSTYYMSWCHPSGSITIALFSYFCHHFDTPCEKERQHDTQLELSASPNKGCFLYYSKKQASKVTGIFWESWLLVCNRKQHEVCYNRRMHLKLREHKSSPFLSFILTPKRKYECSPIHNSSNYAFGFPTFV